MYLILTSKSFAMRIKSLKMSVSTELIIVVLLSLTTVTFSNLCENIRDNVLLPNVNNCSLFYKCLNGSSYVKNCGLNLHFDPDKLKCISLEEANCQVNIRNDTKNNEENYVLCPPQINPRDDILLPNLKDCSSFYHCSYGRPFLQFCPKGLHFNKKKRICDWIEKAKCKITRDG